MRTTTKHRFLAALLSLCMVLSLFGGMRVIAEDEPEQGLDREKVTLPIFPDGKLGPFAITLPIPDRLTGETATMVLNVSNTDFEQKYVLRVYLQYERAKYGDVTFPTTLDVVTPFQYHLITGPEEEKYGYGYYQIGPIEKGSTETIRLPFEYPNESSGGKVDWWFATALEATFDQEALEGAYLDPNKTYPDVDIYSKPTYTTTWVTDRAEYDVDKTTDGDWWMHFGDQVTIKNLSYQVGFEEKEYTTKDNGLTAGPNGYRDKGADYVKNVVYQDVLELPTGLQWRSGLESASYRTVRLSDPPCWQIFAKIPGEEEEYLVATLAVSEGGTDVSVDQVAGKYENGNVVISWRANNSKVNTKRTAPNNVNAGEINDVKFKLTYGPEVILCTDYSEEEYDKKSSVGFDFTNTVTTDLQYFCSTDTYRSSKRLPDSREIDTTGSVILKKERIPEYQRGEDKENGYFFLGNTVTYKITAQNETPFNYTDYAVVTDNMDAFHYIKADNILKMLDEVKGTDERAEIVITKATLVDDIIDGAVTGAEDQTPDLQLGVQNTGADSTYNAKVRDAKHVLDDDATLTLSYVGEVLTLKVESNGGTEAYTIGEGGGYTYPSIGAAFQAIGYVVTRNATYTVNWYKENGKLEKGTTREYKVYATFKDSFMLLTEDMRKMYGNADHFDVDMNAVVEESINTVHVTDQKGVETYPAEGDTPKKVKLHPDFTLQKGFSVEHSDVEDGQGNVMFEDGSVLQNHLLIHHNGDHTYDALPVVDQSTGAQAMIVKVSDNPGVDWATQAEIYDNPYDGQKYYLLIAPSTPGESYTYKGVWVSGYFVDSSQETRYYADSVTVTRETDGKGSITTLAKWYLTDLDTSQRDIEINYRTLSDRERLGCDPGLRASVSNWAYLSDRDSHRLYDFKGGASFKLDFDKNIVTKRDPANPGYDTLDQDRFTWISQNANQVTYRLDFSLNGEGTLALTTLNFYDLLPDNAGVFKWHADGADPNVALRYVLTGNTAQLQLGEGEVYTTTNSKLDVVSPGTEFTIVAAPEGGSDGQKIVWNNDFKLTLSADKNNRDRAYIYVTLTFPGGDNKTAWDNYLKKNNEKNNLYLYNTLYVENWPVQVRHQLSDPGKALLQKGVYETGFYTTDNNNNAKFQNASAYYRRDDRYTYVNNIGSEYSSPYLQTKTTTRGVVTYYVVIVNKSQVPLYLDSIYDVLPKGFDYLMLRNCVNPASADGVGHIGEFRDYGPPRGNGLTGSLIVEDKPNVGTWGGQTRGNVHTNVKCSTAGFTDGHRILKFDIYMENYSDSIANIEWAGVGYDSEVKQYYLRPGYYLQFGYECTTGLESQSEDVAYNAAAMPVTERGAEFILDKTCPVTVDTSQNDAPLNDGKRYLWDNDTAVQHGFTAGKAGTQWLASDVTVYRSKDVVPGIEKTVTNDKRNPVATDAVPWTIKASNDGPATLSNYKIEERMQAPYHFVGYITYTNYTTNTAVQSRTLSPSRQP